MADKKETVILEIEGSTVECNKDVLIKNSDYFSAMLTGSFKESSQQTIKIQGVDLKAFNTIQLLLWDQTYVIDDKEIHLVLQAACMLQFDAIKQLCETRIIEILNPSICIKTWKTAELLDLSPLWLKAKCMALEDFNNICDSNQLLEFSLDEICLYLSHTYLNAESELTVFQTAMNWWYENQELCEHEDRTKLILRLLNCVDFNRLRDNEIREMQSYPDISANIISILNCVLDLRTNGINVRTDVSEEQFIIAVHLCNSRRRTRPEIPCILFQSDWTDNPCPKKRTKSRAKCKEEDEANVVIYDKFLRKRILLKVLECSPHNNFFYNSDLSSLLYDSFSNEFRNFFVIGGDKVKDLAGFKLLPYKEYIFLYGGEYLIGAGNWNCNFWTYDTFKEKWERKNMLPHGRRHFETIIVDGCIYIIGGVGKFRVIQENLLWYDFKADKWSSTVPLPDEERHLKCGCFYGQLFIIYLAARRAYFLNKELLSWRRVNIQIEKAIVDDMGDFTVFSYMNYFYIKGRYLIKFKLDGEVLVSVRQEEMKDVEYEEIESVLCNHTVYTLYKCLDEHYNFFYTFESFNLETEKLHYVFENKVQGKDTIKVDDKLFCPTQYTKLFSFNFFYLVKDDICINDPIV